jgi:hypothetical protein
MSRKFLYRRLGSAVIVILAFFAVTARTGAAQGTPQLKRPEDIPREKPAEPTKKKKVKGPRAVGLYELNSNGKGTLIPVAILVDGKFYDASAYKADPVPMALDSGTVYEVEQSGDSQGLFTVSGALHSRNPGSANPWIGAGSYLANGTETAKATHKAEDVPVGLDSSDSDGPPRLSRGKTSNPAAPANPTPSSGAPASGTPASGSPAGTGSSEKPAATSTPPASSQPASAQPGGGSPGSASSGQDAQKPAAPSTAEKPADASAKPAATATTAGQTPPGPASQGQGENYYRPTLRRGKPTQAAPQEEEDAAPKSGKPESPATAAASPGPVKVVPAISDGGGPDPHSYQFFWKTGEEDERRNQMLDLAGSEVRAYAEALARNQIPAKPPAAKGTTAGHKAPAKPAQPVFEKVQFHAFDVWANNQIVMILTAEAHFPPVPGAAAAPEQYSITLVTRTDIYGNLRKLYSGVTDKFHLDVTPRLELIDVVDADGDGRGELLFRETTDAGTGYLIYRATADKLWKMFDSLGG